MFSWLLGYKSQPTVATVVDKVLLSDEQLKAAGQVEGDVAFDEAAQIAAFQRMSSAFQDSDSPSDVSPTEDKDSGPQSVVLPVAAVTAPSQQDILLADDRQSPVPDHKDDDWMVLAISGEGLEEISIADIKREEEAVKAAIAEEKRQEDAKLAAINALFSEDVDALQDELSVTADRQSPVVTEYKEELLGAGEVDEDEERDLEAGYGELDENPSLLMPRPRMYGSPVMSPAMMPSSVTSPFSTLFCWHLLQQSSAQPAEVKQSSRRPDPDSNIFEVGGPLSGWDRVIAPCYESMFVPSRNASPATQGTDLSGSQRNNRSNYVDEDALENFTRLSINAWT